MSLKAELEKIVLSIPRINENRDYWFVRTEGGEYYEDFISGNYIAIGYDKVSLFDISKAADTKNIDRSNNRLADRIREIYPEEKGRALYPLNFCGSPI